MARDLFLHHHHLFVLLPVLLVVLDRSLAKTDQPDVSALNVMYGSLNSPSQLTGWSSSGGDPCGKGWKGITCSGSSVTEISLSGLGLTGTLGYQLSSLTSVTNFDVSKNNLQGDIPYQLPPNAVHMNLAGNAFTGGVPYSISQMADLEDLNLGSNQLNGQLTDMFGKLSKLSLLDLSLNRFSGNLPQSFKSLSSLKTLNLQNNQFSGTINVLANLPLEDLNVQNNQFTGSVPHKLKDIENLETGGNSWSSGSSDSDEDSNGNSSGGRERHSAVNGVAIAGIVIAVLVAALIILTLVKRISRSSSHYIDGRSHYIDEQLSQNRSFTPLVSDDFRERKESSSIDIKDLQKSPSVGLKPPPSILRKSSNDNEFASKFNSKRSTEPISVTSYPLVDLQEATGSFNSSRLLGQGNIGRVFKAKYTDGKVLAVKKIDTINFSGGTSYEFMEVVTGITKLHHPNISELVGYCSEPGYHLLVYDFQSNGSLHGFLHLSDDYSKPLTWDTRVRIALGTARAVEYLHEVCSPSITHKNIKSANILLDAELNPHLSDCGLAMFYEDTSENLGPGYNAPECAKSSAYTIKSDVYSFGVVMLELLTGRKPFDSSRPRVEQSLVRWATPQLHDIDALCQMVDPALRGLYPPKSLSRFADVIALCVQSEPEFRPATSEVVQALVRCVQRTSINKRLGGDMSTSRRSDDSDSYY
ncbi:protein STRUBBELIG-RECEPTOR FAMILY 5-like isoform X1 [Typha latifolia]|uniref:protein STRUBBELIG-RECEPTOR FAMILY 5-like isoform X1 n=3 Tax=Typha latifolia TaxID=4733 RepID=UPI003C2F487A